MCTQTRFWTIPVVIVALLVFLPLVGCEKPQPAKPAGPAAGTEATVPVPDEQVVDEPPPLEEPLSEPQEPKVTEPPEPKAQEPAPKEEKQPAPVEEKQPAPSAPPVEAPTLPNTPKLPPRAPAK